MKKSQLLSSANYLESSDSLNPRPIHSRSVGRLVAFDARLTTAAWTDRELYSDDEEQDGI